MVDFQYRLVLLFSILLMPTITFAQDSLTVDELKERFKISGQKKQSASERLKASRPGNPNLKLISKKDIGYRLPNNKVVTGILLPNGLVAPATYDNGKTVPACVTTDYRLVAGYFDPDNNAVKCNLKSAELAMITGISKALQLGIDSEKTGRVSLADKYGSNSTLVKDKKVEAELLVQDVRNGAESNTIKKKANKYNSTSSSDDYIFDVKPQKNIDPNIYIPPPRNINSSSAVAGVLTRTGSKYGILMGTWIKAELIRPASSADSGLIEYRLLETIDGKFQTLPVNTVLFANKKFNVSNRRLESFTVSAITPNGKEINGINARVYSLDKSAGLAGAVIRNRNSEIKAAGVNTLIRTAVNMVPGGEGVAGQAVGEFSNQMLDNEADASPTKEQPLIKVEPQTVWLKVAKTF